MLYYNDDQFTGFMIFVNFYYFTIVGTLMIIAHFNDHGTFFVHFFPFAVSRKEDFMNISDFARNPISSRILFLFFQSDE